MASPKAIKDASVVAPAAPAEVVEADDADPGEVSEAKAAAAERAAEEWSSKTVGGVSPSKTAKTGKPDPAKTSWIEVQLVDEDGKGIPGEPYMVIAGDGSQYTGTTDEQGVGRIGGIDPGSYDITFPCLDKDAWEPA